METSIFSDLNVDILIVLALVFFLIIWFVIKRNRKDRKDLERELNANEMKAEKHDEEHI